MARGPVVIDADTLDQATASPADAPPVPDQTEIADTAAMVRMARGLGRRRSPFALLFWWALTSLILLTIGVTAWDFVAGLLTRNAVLGQVASVLIGIVVIGALIFAAREFAGLLRLSKIDAMQSRVRAAGTLADRSAAATATRDVARLYQHREDMRLACDEFARKAADEPDAQALLAFAERTLMTSLDAAARAEIEAASRRVAGVTALVPLALVDVAAALVENIRMIRRIADIYGGRGGTLGSWRLLRSVAAHLIATGAVAVGDDMIGTVAGGGALAKISRRFGEGVVNGALTARVGVAAMEVCRPMPFAAVDRPKVTSILGRALKGLFKAGD